MIRVKNILWEDFVQYHKPCMFIGFPECSMKCGKTLCQNHELLVAKDVIIDPKHLVEQYVENPITKAIICGGLDPIDTSEDLMELVDVFRRATNDEIVIYTGYTEQEVKDMLVYAALCRYDNIILKVGRYIPGQKPHRDPILGVNLANDEQYAFWINKKEN